MRRLGENFSSSRITGDCRYATRKSENVTFGDFIVEINNGRGWKNKNIVTQVTDFRISGSLDTTI